MVDTTGLEQQITASIESYMQGAFSSYGTAVAGALESQITSAMEQMMNQIAGSMETVMTQMMSQIGNSLQNAMSIDADAFASAFTMNMDGEDLKELMMSMGSGSGVSYESNLQSLGYADLDEPSGIDIYLLDFESKEKIVEILDNYNDRMTAQGKEDQVITYTDMVGTLMSSVTDIIDIISYVLIAFVAIFVLSVMLTLIGGLIPSKKAAKSDPVTALRTD